MKVEKKNNKYYVNDLDLEEVMANRKYVNEYVTREIARLKSMIEDLSFGNKTIMDMKIRLKTLTDIQNKLRLRK
jgi:hypothetical protein